jgi:hypothetical protein
MKLADFYARIGPFLLGEIDHQAVVPALWGKDPPTPDAGRLRIYGRFCQVHRAEAVDDLFAACRKVVVGRDGEAAWTQLTEDYFRAHPMHHFELNRNGEHFAEFLKGPAAATVPPFLAELADLEWWEWQSSIALDEPGDADPDQGPLRLGSTVEVRPYAWDLLTWLDDYSDEDRPAEPEAEASRVLFWRDRQLRGRRGPASSLELFVLKAVVESVPLSVDLAARLGVAVPELAETAADLHAAGVILGDRAQLPLSEGEGEEGAQAAGSGAEGPTGASD